jgi:hypothetical protein
MRNGFAVPWPRGVDDYAALDCAPRSTPQLQLAAAATFILCRQRLIQDLKHGRLTDLGGCGGSGSGWRDKRWRRRYQDDACGRHGCSLHHLGR